MFPVAGVKTATTVVVLAWSLIENAVTGTAAQFSLDVRD